MTIHVRRVDPLEVDLETADAIAEIGRASLAAAGLDLAPEVGPSTLMRLRTQSDNRPVDGLWLADTDDGPVGWASLTLPWRENTTTAALRGQVHPSVRRRGIGSALHAHAVEMARAAGRTTIHSGGYDSADLPALPAMGYRPTLTNAIRRLDVHAGTLGRWQRLCDDAAAVAVGYEIVRQVGSTPDERLGGIAALHEAINDAPLPDPDMEADAWTPERVTSYETAMAARRQTLYRVIARHRETGAWAGQSLLCVDEFAPSIAHQEDTVVVRAHRGHRLGLLMKADMLRWIGEERPEVRATDTWNAVTNHHMIAVNEVLGTTVVGHYVSHSLSLAQGGTT